MDFMWSRASIGRSGPPPERPVHGIRELDGSEARDVSGGVIAIPPGLGAAVVISTWICAKQST